MMHNFQCENDPVLTVNSVCVCVCVCVFLSYLRLEFDGEDVLPSRGVLCLQSQRLELGVYEEQPEDGRTQYMHNKSTSIHREGYT